MVNNIRIYISVLLVMLIIGVVLISGYFTEPKEKPPEEGYPPNHAVSYPYSFIATIKIDGENISVNNPLDPTFCEDKDNIIKYYNLLDSEYCRKENNTIYCKINNSVCRFESLPPELSANESIPLIIKEISEANETFRKIIEDGDIIFRSEGCLRLYNSKGNLKFEECITPPVDLDIGNERKPKKTTKKISVAIFVDDNTYLKLSNELERFKQDIINDLTTETQNVSVYIFHDWNYSIKEGESAIEVIKNAITYLWKNENLVGVILVGDVPVKYYHLPLVGAELREWAPSDWYYMDVEGTCTKELNETHAEFIDPFYEGSPCPLYPRIWVARIKPPVEGDEGIELLKDYFDRNHKYRTGKLNYTKNIGFYFVSEEWDKESLFKNVLEPMVKSVDFYSEFSIDDVIVGHSEEYDRKYLEMLKLPYQYIYYNGHGNYFLSQYNISSDLIKQTRPQAMFYELVSCGSAPFDLENYLAGWYLFSGNGLLVKAYVEPVIVPDTPLSYQMEKRLTLLRRGMPYGEYILTLSSAQAEGLGVRGTLLGDPTLKFNYEKITTDAELSLSAYELDFGSVTIGTTKELNVTIYNLGTKKLFLFDDINRVKGWDGAVEREFHCEFEWYNGPDLPSDGLYVAIPPNSSCWVTLSFTPKEKGEYEYFWEIISNSENNFYVKVPIYGRGT